MLNFKKNFIVILVFATYGLLLLFLTSCSEAETAPLIVSQNSITFKDKTTLLVFLTNDCEGCTQLTSNIKNIAHEYTNKLQIIAIFTRQPNQGISKNSEQDYVKNKFGPFFQIIFDEDGKIFNQYQINGWPTTVLINKSGLIEKRIYGAQSAAYFSNLMDKILHGDNSERT